MRFLFPDLNKVRIFRSVPRSEAAALVKHSVSFLINKTEQEAADFPSLMVLVGELHCGTFTTRWRKKTELPRSQTGLKVSQMP